MVVAGWWVGRVWREVRDREGVRWRKYPDSSLICSTITPSELCWEGCTAVPSRVRSYLHFSSFHNPKSFFFFFFLYSHKDIFTRKLINAALKKPQ